ncbi:AAA family ATPase [Duganella sp. FT80W]|uniref:AAA family ATPase n=1 Tax=Duganella guangzhouensis TaxID=2666084 RepID=A0A6I2KS26_9BURK|nr:AAA family ATPase [Duganella guangzhouensis]MRW88398.1 AAA family ATPase [Duganella guangzhouensis]
MYLATLEITNFRKIDYLSTSFSQGLNIILGENNIGKTTVVDALRTLLMAPEDGYIRLGLEDARDPNTPSISFHFVFKNLNIEQAAQFMGAVLLQADGTFSAEFWVQFEAPDQMGRFKARRLCGDRAATPMTTEMVEQLRSIYLPPLRDASKSLKPGMRSLLARLLQRVATPEGLEACNQILTLVDQRLGAAQPITAAKDAISRRYSEMLGATLSQQLDLNLSPSDIGKVASRLAILADGFDIEKNGLGYNNLIYMAAVMGELSLSGEVVYRCLIVEEPEAHLHPQLQSILLAYLQQEAAAGGQQVQIFVTTHSPHFAAFAELDSVIRLSEHFGKLTAFPIKDAVLDERRRKKLKRYLDVTRADLFFARSVILVEGAAERALMPVMAEYLNINLRHLGLSIVSAEGLNFDCFLPLFGRAAMPVKVATMTDGDPTHIPFPSLGQAADISANAHSIQQLDEAFRKVFISPKTLEYDLGLQGHANRALILDALSEIHPQIAATLREAVFAEQDNTIAARVLYQGLFERNAGATKISKGALAQELAQKLSARPQGFIVPPHIRAAFDWIRVAVPPLAPLPAAAGAAPPQQAG